MLGLLMTTWLTGAFGLAAGWATRSRLRRSREDISTLGSRVRGRLRHGCGMRHRRTSVPRSRHLRRGTRPPRPARIHDRAR